MKVLLITTTYDNGAVGPATFAKYLKSNSLFSCDILTENTNEIDGVHSLTIKQNWLEKKLSIFFRIKPYHNKLKKIADNYDILLFSSSIISHGFKSSTPMITMINDDNLLNPKSGLNRKGILTIFYRRIEKAVAKNNDPLIVNSNYLKKLIQQFYSPRKENIHVLYKATVIPQNPKTLPLISNKEIRIIFIKNDYVRGGLFDLISALNILTQYSFTLTVVGCSPRLSKTNTSKHVNLNIVGLLPHEELQKEYCKHHICCVPSRKEALGVVNLEAMANGISIVTTGVGGIPEVVTQNEGWISKPQDPISLAKTIKLCIESSNERLLKIENAKNKVHSFSKDVMLQKLEQILKQTISEKSISE